MKTRWMLIAAIVATLVVLTAGIALACPVCGAPSKTTISGPGIDGTLEVTDAKVTASLGMDQFFGWQNRRPIDPPANPGAGYDLIRSWPDFPSDHLRYYANSSGTDYIFYTPDSHEIAKQLDMENMIDHWFAATPSEDTIMQRLFKSINVTPQSSTSTSSAVVATVTNNSVSPVWPIGLLAGVIVIGSGVIVLRRKRA